MEQYKYIEDYKNNDKYIKSFNKLMKNTFGFDLENWFKSGYSKHYTCHSLVDNEVVIANVSTSKIVFKVEGIEKTAIQIGTVMTDPNYRNQGLSRYLMEYVTNKYQSQCDFLYLFANDSVKEFYPKFGFKDIEESIFSMTVENENNIGDLRKLDINNKNDLDLIIDFAESGRYYSNVLDVIDNKDTFIFYCLNVYSDKIYYSKTHNCLVIYETKGDCLEVYAVLMNEEIELKEIINQLTYNGIKKVNLYFTPGENNEYTSKDLNEEDHTLFIKGDFNIKHNFIFPMTSRA